MHVTREGVSMGSEVVGEKEEVRACTQLPQSSNKSEFPALLFSQVG
jgi:hypothetical protein